MTKADIQLVRALADKRGRTEHGLFVAEGEKLIGELRASHLSVRRIFSLEGVFNGPEVETVAPRDMERLSLLKTPSNSLALVEIPRCDLKPERLRGRLTLALDDVQNPGNLGTIIRLADWFGITDIVCSEASADCFNPKVVQATMGAILRVRVHYTDLAALLSKAAALGLPVCGTFLEGANIYETELKPAGIVVMAPSRRNSSSRPGRPTAGVRNRSTSPWPRASSVVNFAARRAQKPENKVRRTKTHQAPPEIHFPGGVRCVLNRLRFFRLLPSRPRNHGARLSRAKARDAT